MAFQWYGTIMFHIFSKHFRFHGLGFNKLSSFSLFYFWAQAYKRGNLSEAHLLYVIQPINIVSFKQDTKNAR